MTMAAVDSSADRYVVSRNGEEKYGLILTGFCDINVTIDVHFARIVYHTPFDLGRVVRIARHVRVETRGAQVAQSVGFVVPICERTGERGAVRSNQQKCDLIPSVAVRVLERHGQA